MRRLRRSMNKESLRSQKRPASSPATWGSFLSPPPGLTGHRADPPEPLLSSLLRLSFQSQILWSSPFSRAAFALNLRKFFAPTPPLDWFISSPYQWDLWIKWKATAFMEFHESFGLLVLRSLIFSHSLSLNSPLLLLLRLSFLTSVEFFDWGPFTSPFRWIWISDSSYVAYYMVLTCTPNKG